MNQATGYWEERFGEFSQNHSIQNTEISKDFMKGLHGILLNIFEKSNSIIEIGCGTGELSEMLHSKFGKNIIGVDLSPNAIGFANKTYSKDGLKYLAYDCLNESIKNIGLFDLAICSNTLEHFTNPYIMIDQILDAADTLVILVPYKQPVKDGYACEGGAGHVFMFDENSFPNYEVVDWYTFRTNGWQHSSDGEIPLQLCITIKNKK